ncbi:MAG: hypothetical protein AAB074_16975 [Planctomycetota bacterium]
MVSLGLLIEAFRWDAIEIRQIRVEDDPPSTQKKDPSLHSLDRNKRSIRCHDGAPKLGEKAGEV